MNLNKALREVFNLLCRQVEIANDGGICQPGLIALIAQYGSIVWNTQYICLFEAYEMWKSRAMLCTVAHIITEAEDLKLFRDNKMSSPVVADMFLCHKGKRGCH